jgi:predicted membrane protein
MVLYILLNIVSFFRVLFVIIMIYYGFKMVMKFIAPRVVEKAADKLFQDMKNREAANNRQTVRKGDITIDYSDKKPKQYKRADGDYIEFEEIDDKK